MLTMMRAALRSRRRHILALPAPDGCGWQVWDSALGWQPQIFRKRILAYRTARKFARRLWHSGQGRAA